MCAVSALTQMNFASGEPSQMADGPFTYKQLQNYYQISFSHVATEELLCAEVSSNVLLNVGRHGVCGHAVGLVPEVHTHTYLLSV